MTKLLVTGEIGMAQNESVKQLQSMLSEYDLRIDESDLVKLIEYQEILLQKNEQVNLTAIREWNKSLVLNLLDSLLIAPVFERTDGKFIDIGTGAGLPGIPLAIVSGRKGVLLDSTGKKIAAVDEFIHQLGLQNHVKAVNARVEEYALKHRCEFGCAVARAVAQSDVLLEYARPLLKTGGHCILTKGNITEEETSNAINASKVLGYELVSRETYELVDGMGHREILDFKVTNKSRIRLPRMNGEAKRKPLSLL